MIHRIYSDLPTFKSLTFKDGLNVLLAEKSEGATDRHTRNRAGKSSMVELVHFILAAKAEPGSLFRRPALVDSVFGLDFDLGGSRVRAERSGAKHGQIAVQGDFVAWPVQPRAKDGSVVLGNNGWRNVLANQMFGVDEQDESWTPTFRSMISYFARRERAGGLHTPVRQSTQQSTADYQINLSYLLGLDWSIPQGWQEVRDREKRLGELKKSLKEGAFGQVIDKASTIKTQLVLARDRLERLKLQVASFRIVDEYHEMERESSDLTARLATLADENTLDRRYIAELERTLQEEVPPPPPDLERLYTEAGAILPDLVRRRFDDVKAFHESVIRNRQSYLRGEVESAKRRLTERGEEQKRLDERRSEILGILNSAGALEQFSALQREVVRNEVTVENLRQKYDAAEALESGTLKLKMERSRLQERLRQDYSERDEMVNEAILTFQEISSALYEESGAGSLTLNPTENGPEFEIQIQGSKSRGVSNMQIFCFDMMLTLLSLRRGRSPGFLIHDSHLFDGVDERQAGKALALGAELADKHGFQYIVTMNTDDIPKETPPGFVIEDHALSVRLSDATEDGGLFGIRFD